MYLNVEGAGKRPVGLPSAADLKTSIAREAARLSNGDEARFIRLIGALVPTTLGKDRADTGWRLSSYSGSIAETHAIERAAATLQRSMPLMRLR